MAGRLRTIMLVVGIGATLVVLLPPAGADAGLGDVLGILSGGQDPPPPPQPPPSKPRPPDGGGAQSPGRPVGSSKDPLLAPESSCPGQSDPGLPAAVQERAMVCMQNYARVAYGLSALHAYKPLRVSATQKARDIRRCHVLSHEACGRALSYWFARVGFLKGSWVVGEILAFGGPHRGTVRATMESWLNSRPHRAVLLDSRFTRVGVGTVTGRFRGLRGMRIWVTHFGYRR